MQAGKLNRRVDILAPVSTRDPNSGAEIISWNTVATTWASIDIQRSSLVYETSAFMSKVAYRITIRYRTGITFNGATRLRYTEPTTNIVHTYEVQAVLNTEAANREIILMCYELEGQE